jgi:hypothetical protein
VSAKTIIGLLGRAGSGKSSVAAYLEARYGARRYSFASPLKKMAGKIWDFSDEQLYGTADIKEKVDPRHNITPRHAMQMLGQTAREFIHPNVWVEACMNEIYKGDSQLCVIEDVRHVNEAAYIAGARGDGFVIKLVCEDSISDPKFSLHPSEAQVDQVSDSLIFGTVRAPRSPGASLLLKAFDVAANPILQGRQHTPIDR